MNRTFLFIVSVLPMTVPPGGGHAQASAPGQETALAGQTFDHAHAAYAEVLAEHIRDGLVNYTALKKHRKPLDRYLASLAAVSQDEFDGWTKSQRMAFLINAYNAYTLQLIIEHYPVKSIKDIGGWIRGPWKQPVVHLWGESSTLNDIEHGMLRKTYEDSRVHFALVCASLSCPVLRPEAYRAKDLEAQLNDAGEKFLADRTRNTFDLSKRTAGISSIFKWFRSDFGAGEPEVLVFLSRFVSRNVARSLVEGGWDVSYLPYDWSLNDRASATP